MIIFNNIYVQLENPAFYADADLMNIIRKAVYMSSTEGNKNLNHHEPLAALPPFTVNQNQQQRLRNEIIASTTVLPSVVTSSQKRPLRRFWEMRIPEPDCETRVKNRRTISCLALLVICLTVVVIGVSAFTYCIGMYKNLY